MDITLNCLDVKPLKGIRLKNWLFFIKNQF